MRSTRGRAHAGTHVAKDETICFEEKPWEDASQKNERNGYRDEKEDCLEESQQALTELLGDNQLQHYPDRKMFVETVQLIRNFTLLGWHEGSIHGVVRMVL